ncbi:MAG: RagB/SusD family nutrient uptake outer membrane protein [Prevotellaceae bacterium]|jgi:hypothetical protein|nr:RagB/SusD family nutrient uptake outer membrane protein [Prevotellaceae bacterium]
MKNSNIIKLLLAVLPALLFTSCIKDLDRFPENDVTGQVVYATFDGYKGAIAKVYAGYTLTGNAGGSGYGKPDITGLDEGSNGDFLRCFFNHQEMPTDEAHCIWNDPGVPELNNINFIATNAFTIGLYDKSILQIMYANEFLKNSTAGEMSGKGFTAEQQNEIKAFRAEARFLRAFQYWVLMDVFGNPPFVTEESEFGVLPSQTDRATLFNYVESELIDLVDNNLLKDAKSNEYGRADKAAAWALLARLYLNAEVYMGTPKYTEAITYSKKVIDAGYTLKGTYEQLFLADNDLNNPEVILSINYDGKRTRLDGGTSFLINCSSNGDYQSDYAATLIHYGITDNANWSGYRARKEFTDKFATGDKRFLFVGANKAIADHPGEYPYGLATYKYRNITSASTPGNPVYGSDIRYADNDFPLFRLAEMYLIYAEAVKRGGSGGTEALALTYINNLRERAYGNTSGNISASDLTLNFILDERARELYWECQRRTDLIRYNQFTTGDYLWEWKGGVQVGRAVSGHFNIYPLPSPDLQANTNLKQNPQY